MLLFNQILPNEIHLILYIERNQKIISSFKYYAVKSWGQFTPTIYIQVSIILQF